MPDRPAPERPVAPSMGVVVPEALGRVLPTAEALGLEAEALTQWQLAWRRFKRHRLAMASLVVLLVIGVAVAIAGLLTPYGFSEFITRDRLQPPNAKHWLGTDQIGHDQFARILYGGRISLAVGVGVALSSGVVGTLVGAASGYYGGRLDAFLMRLTDLFLSIPALVVLIIAGRALGDTFLGPVIGIVVALSLFFWMPAARIVRGLFLSLKEREFVEAARSVGASNRRIIFRHILPNAMGPIIVYVTLAVAAAILTESTLSFLGFGIQPPTPTWGNMLAEARVLFRAASWLVYFPGLMILLTVLAVNFLGDGLRDALDPTQRRVRA